MSTDTVDDARCCPTASRTHYLVNAEREARRRGLFEIPIVDCDSHCYETACLPEIVAYMETPNITPLVHVQLAAGSSSRG